MNYKPIEYIPQTSSRTRIQPASELDNPGPWTIIACKLCGVVAVLASFGMLYLVIMAGMGRW